MAEDISNIWIGSNRQRKLGHTWLMRVTFKDFGPPERIRPHRHLKASLDWRFPSMQKTFIAPSIPGERRCQGHPESFLSLSSSSKSRLSSSMRFSSTGDGSRCHRRKLYTTKCNVMYSVRSTPCTCTVCMYYKYGVLVQ